MTTWLPGGDALNIDRLPADVLATFRVLFPYGPNLGAHGGPARQTPQAWTAAQPQPKWCIFFPGADPAQALAYTRSVHAVGVVVDIEPGVENDAWTLAQASAFGDYMRANGMPCAVYSHQATCESLAAHFAAQFWDGQPEPASVPARVAIQYGQQTASNGVAYDLDACDSYFLNPREDDMGIPVIYTNAEGTAAGAVQDGTWVPMDIPDVTVMSQRGVVVFPVSDVLYASLPPLFPPRTAGATSAQVAQILAAVQAIPAGGLTTAQSAQLTDVQAHVDADLH
jgi:hypothetical protein